MLDSTGISRIVEAIWNAEREGAPLLSILQFFELHSRRHDAQFQGLNSAEEVTVHVSRLLLDTTDPWRALMPATSGTTGAPKRIRHERTLLEAEVESWRQLLPNARRVISLIPSHHLYGLIWTVLWPNFAGLQVVEARAWSPGDWQPELREGDVIVAVPMQWANLLKVMDAIPSGVTGISSAGELPQATWEAAAQHGLQRMIEVYGSTETGGVATRESHDAFFLLAPHWRDRKSDWFAELPDYIEPAGGDRFRLRGRKDGAIKIAGLLVQTDELERLIRSCSGALDCQVRIRDGQFEALIATDLQPARRRKLELEILNTLAAKLPAAALAKQIQFVDQLPRNAMGKGVGW